MSRLALAAPALVPAADGVDATLQRYFGPFAEGLAGIVFYAVPIFGTEVPLIVGWLVASYSQAIACFPVAAFVVHSTKLYFVVGIENIVQCQ